MLKKNVIISIMMVVFCLTTTVMAADQDKEQAAVKVSEVWIALVDEGKYADSWSEAAELFKSLVTKEQWEQSIKVVREPLGKIVTRNVKSAQYMTAMPGVPDGEFVVIQFETSFENKKEAIETITPMMDKDGIWRVAGYFIK